MNRAAALVIVFALCGCRRDAPQQQPGASSAVSSPASDGGAPKAAASTAGSGSATVATMDVEGARALLAAWADIAALYTEGASPPACAEIAQRLRRDGAARAANLRKAATPSAERAATADATLAAAIAARTESVATASMRCQSDASFRAARKDILGGTGP